MTPAARIAAAIELIDAIAAGAAPEQALTGWARRARHAGSGDRAAVRDHVFDALRRWRSSAAWGGAETGRGRMIGLLREAGRDPDALFTGEGYAPAPLTAAERVSGGPPADPLVALDCPDWLAPALRESLGDRFGPTLEALRHRAPVWLRANLRKGDREAAAAALADEGIATRPGAASPTALEVLSHPRRVQGSRAYRDGLVELQDAASQALVDRLPVAPGARVLDYCAGGGGKTLALAGRVDARFTVHDGVPRRMADLPARATRAGVAVTPLAPGQGGFDLVLADVPCSGSGTWRRAPWGKWRLTPEELDRLTALQARILRDAAALTAPGGALAYATCALLDAENLQQIEKFVREGEPAWSVEHTEIFEVSNEGDGFFLTLLRRT
ncbi:RsmB/NOP family class I SAM-dependent RNA methyltransferase [Rhodobacteraceae bacterium CCMM004]|nr:RsmB/NOP family class I SAM-dependent RNA methyltransferase [Rhodobacteraceae bacterium CCMM004]